ncbi:hypothetical protein, partial [Burkholderia cepacia]|uniref:hypothetical protein n=1 Tax=Burkholderia cepacia TaxID=292 RepID=UPI001C611726
MFTLLHISDLHRSPHDPIENASLLGALLADQDRYLVETPNRLLKYTPTEATFLRSRGSRRKVYRIVQFQ